jgi:hypothetical protein
MPRNLALSMIKYVPEGIRREQTLPKRARTLCRQKQ